MVVENATFHSLHITPTIRGEIELCGFVKKERLLKLMKTLSFTVWYDYSEICGSYCWLQRML